MKTRCEPGRACRRLIGTALIVAMAGTVFPARADDDDKKLLDKKPAVLGPRVSPDPWKLASRLPDVGGGDAVFPTKNVNVKTWLALNQFPGFVSGDNAADCWGYTSPSGREYALVG